jgi:hypothetical protein
MLEKKDKDNKILMQIINQEQCEQRCSNVKFIYYYGLKITN